MTSTGKNNPKVVFRLGHLGDVALTTGVLAHWHATSGDTFIVITRTANAPIFDNHPAVAEVVPLADAVLKGTAWFKEAQRLARLYKGHTLIDVHGVLRSRVLSLLWRGPVRRYPKFGLTRRLFDRTRAERYGAILEQYNVPQRYAMALDATPPDAVDLVPRIHISETEKAAACVCLAEVSTKKSVVALHPYATHPSKQWPRGYWLELTGLLAGADIDWFVLGRDENPLFENHTRDFTNTTTLRETCALMERATLLVTGDSGPMHLAGGVDTPVIALFGPTAKAWGFYPAGDNDRVLELPLGCRPCSLHGSRHCTRGYECLMAMTPEQVMTVIREFLQKTD